MDRNLSALSWALLAAASLTSACAHRAAEDAHVSLGSGYAEPEGARPAPAADMQAEITRYADANNDGKVTRDEAKSDPMLEKHFARYDVNDDGVLDRGEFARLEDLSRNQRAAAGTPKATADGWTIYEPSLAPDRQGAEVASDPSLNRTGVSRSYRAIRQ
jgi:hypothetical protein